MNDTMYEHLNEYSVVPYSGWTIECGVIHAPGPYPTFEVQLPQDDGNLLAWQLGQTIVSEKERREEKVRSMLRSEVIDAGMLFDQVVDLKLTSDPLFREKYFHPSQILDSGDWGERLQTFFKRFYGEAIRLNPNTSYVLQASEKPCALVVWSGRGTVNGHEVQVEEKSVGLENMSRREMLIARNTKVEITNTDDQETLLLLSVYPFKQASDGARSGVAVAGLSCVDYVIQNCGELIRSTDHVTAENYVKRCGGSVYNTGRCLRFMSRMHQHLCRVEALSLVGEDEDGDFVLSQLQLCGVGTKYVSRSNVANTQVAFLPNYASGERACIVVPGTSSFLHRDHLFGEVGLGCQRTDMLREMLWVNLGYPYELPHMQGEALALALSKLRAKSVDVAVAVDLNGAAASSKFDDENRWPAIASSLQHVCVVHMNWDEALALYASAHRVAGRNDDWVSKLQQSEVKTLPGLKELSSFFFESGVAIVTITLGSEGAFIAVHSDSQHMLKQFGAAAPEEKYVQQWCGTSAVMSEIPTSSAQVLDTVGAGDSFLAGLLMALESMAATRRLSENVKETKELLSEEDKTLGGLLNWAQTCAGQMLSGIELVK
jgi:sugar/nucleoside kinase (ribokinase family)